MLNRTGGSGPTTPTLVGPKILPFAVKVLYFQNFGRTSDCGRGFSQMVGPISHSFRHPAVKLKVTKFQLRTPNGF